MAAENAIFISYRRSDSNDVTGRICDRLKAHFGTKAVFIDYDDIPYGSDFPNHLQQTVDGAKVLLAIIGPTWLEVFKERIDKPKTDWVRSEIERALSQDIFVIPILVNNAQAPDSAELPEVLHSLSRKNAARARAGADFDIDMKRLIGQLEKIVGVQIPTRLMPKQMQRFQGALIDAFPNEDDLEMIVQFYLGRPLNRISRARTYDKSIFDVIQWVNSRNKVAVLLHGALEINPESDSLLAFLNSLSQERE